MKTYAISLQNTKDYVNEVKTLPLKFCYLSRDSYTQMINNGVTDFTNVRAISCIKNPKRLDLTHYSDYFVTTVTHIETGDGSPKSFAFVESRPTWLDPDVPWCRKEDNYSFSFREYMELAHRHGIPIAFYFEDKAMREEGELREMKEGGINPYGVCQVRCDTTGI